MIEHSRKPPFVEVLPILIVKAETAPEARMSQSFKDGVQIAHRL